MRVYLIRHIDKERSRFTGRLEDDTRPSEYGLNEQLPALKEFIREEIHNIEGATPDNVHVMVSPALRTRVTARGVTEALDEEGFLGYPSHTEHDFLREIDKGPVADMHKDRTPQAIIANYKHRAEAQAYSSDPPKIPLLYGESLNDVYDRVEQPIKELLSYAEEGGIKTVFIVGHSANIHEISAVLTGIGKGHATEPFQQTASVRLLEGDLEQGFEDKGIVHGKEMKQFYAPAPSGLTR